MRDQPVGIDPVERAAWPVGGDRHRAGPDAALNIGLGIVQTVSGHTLVHRPDDLTLVVGKVEANDVEADPGDEAAALTLNDPGGVIGLIETVDAVTVQRHAMDAPTQDIDPEQGVFPRRPCRPFTKLVAAL